MSFVVPIALGALTGGMSSVTGSFMSTVSNALWSSTTPTMMAVTGGLMGGIGAMAMNTMMPPVPEQPDYGEMFGQQQSMLTQQQSFGRKPTGELEQMLEFGTDYEKNQAYDELQRRGEDEGRLQDLQTRRGRTEERQGEIDEYIDRNAPPTEDELDILRASLVSEEEDKLDADIEAERTRAKQVMARRGLGSSNALSQLNARLEDVRYKGQLAIRNDVNNRVLSYASGVSALQDQGLTRLMQASSMEEATSRYDLGMQDSERKLQEGLRQSKTAQQNALELNKFRTEVTGLNQSYEQQMQDRSNTMALGLGAMGIAAPRIWPDKPDPAPTTNIYNVPLGGGTSSQPGSSNEIDIWAPPPTKQGV